jgi:hypothetical protein
MQLLPQHLELDFLRTLGLDKILDSGAGPLLPVDTVGRLIDRFLAG